MASANPTRPLIKTKVAPPSSSPFSAFSPGDVVEVYSAKNGKQSFTNRAWHKAVIKEVAPGGVVVYYDGTKVIGLFKNPANVRRAKTSAVASTPAAPARVINDWPSTCGRCGGPAYVGALTVDCKNKCDKRA